MRTRILIQLPLALPQVRPQEQAQAQELTKSQKEDPEAGTAVSKELGRDLV